MFLIYTIYHIFVSVSIKNCNLHLVSDSTGDTLLPFASAVISQFPNTDFRKFAWFLTRTEREMELILRGIRQNCGIVLYTMVSPKFEQMLQDTCSTLNIPCVPILSKTIRTFQRYLGQQSSEIVRDINFNEIPEGYVNRIEAINYTIAHDDGSLLEGLEEADIIVIGASRTSKTPVSIYLAYRGYRVANIPFVNIETFPQIVYNLKIPLIVGLVADPERLELIRKTRISSINGDIAKSTYTDIEKIREEVAESRKLFARLQCPVINITERSIEETSVHIMKQLTRKIVISEQD